MFLNKWLSGSALIVLLLAGCGDDSSTDIKGKSVDVEEVDSKEKVLASEDFDKMYTNPKKYKKYEVTYVGKVLQSPEVDDDGIYLQVYAKPEKYEQNTIVYYPDATFKVSESNYVEIVGIVKDEFVGENMMGAELKMPLIEAKEMKVISYTDAVAPTLQAIDVQEAKDQHGYQLTLEKVELADSQTRVYFTVTNNSKHKINFYDFNSKLIANGKQLEKEEIYESDLKSVQSDILPGASSSGVVIYPALEEGTTKIQVYAEGSSDNYELSIEPFMFDVKID
ncbi:DUF5067 domain-containing protein [Sporosarcina sp. GW1-11]|uniref:DUF5067 domain-containing protein n=1 Tax=Sporosarcina sp. GW1-11 TaxID=2899126 RepID=UPI00294C8A5A|nr:DUF5067 domain-containing protein [Sporosarcina sp. GW1-11]MDV6377150.1 DUF5067 domain-containing protein [Sporosarcina sp. GW1-11]